MQQGFFDNRLEKKSCKPLDIQVFFNDEMEVERTKMALDHFAQTLMNGELIRAKRR